MHSLLKVRPFLGDMLVSGRVRDQGFVADPPGVDDPIGQSCYPKDDPMLQEAVSTAEIWLQNVNEDNCLC